MTVSNLFYNTPARLKYVKTIQTELANIGDIVNRLALSHPKVAFRLVHDGHKMMSTTGNGDLKQTIAGIYGISTAKKMLKIEGKDLDFTLTGMSHCQKSHGPAATIYQRLSMVAILKFRVK